MASEDRVLQIILRARDEASAVLESVGKETNKLGSLFKDSFQKATIVSTAALGALTLEAVRSVQAFDESQKMLAQLDSVLKSTGGIAGVTRDQVISLASSLQSSTTYTDEAVLSAENLLLTFTNIGKDVFPDATRTVLDMSTALGQDTKASAVQLGKALQDPIQGINALRRVGVNFTDAQKDVIEKLVNSGKQIEAQKLILKELSTEFGGSAQAAARTFGGKITQLMNKVNDLEETMGGLIAQRLEPLVGTVLEIVDAFSKVVDGTSSLSDFTQILSDKLGILGDIAGGVITFFAEHQQALIALAGAISGFLTIAIIGATIAMMSFIGVSLPVIAIAAAIGAVAALIIANWSNISGFFQSIGDTIAGIFNSIYATIVSILTTIWNTVSPILTAIWTIFSTVFNAIFQIVSWVFQQIWTIIQFYLMTYTAIFQTFLIGLQLLWNQIWGALGPYVQQVWSMITSFVSGGMSWISNLVSSGLTAIRSIWENSWKSKYDTVVTWIEKIKSFVSDGIEKVKQMFRDLADSISNILKNIHIPSLHIEVEEADVAGQKIKVPKLKWYEQGGFVPNTGPAYLHAGEFVLSKDMLSGQSSVPQNVSTIFDQPISIQAIINSPMDVSKLGYELAWMLRNSR